MLMPKEKARVHKVTVKLGCALKLVMTLAELAQKS
jgi:hypothetical protein